MHHAMRPCKHPLPVIFYVLHLKREQGSRKRSLVEKYYMTQVCAAEYLCFIFFLFFFTEKQVRHFIIMTLSEYLFGAVFSIYPTATRIPLRTKSPNPLPNFFSPAFILSLLGLPWPRFARGCSS